MVVVANKRLHSGVASASEHVEHTHTSYLSLDLSVLLSLVAHLWGNALAFPVLDLGHERRHREL